MNKQHNITDNDSNSAWRNKLGHSCESREGTNQRNHNDEITKRLASNVKKIKYENSTTSDDDNESRQNEVNYYPEKKFLNYMTTKVTLDL
jgi:hypothetical protein